MASNDDSRKRILDAAGPIFAEVGFEKATVREICRRANVNVASINYHFGSKEQLYKDLIRHIHETNRPPTSIPTWPEGASIEEKLQAFVREMLVNSSKRDKSSWQFKLMLTELFQPTGLLKEMVEECIKPHFGQLLQILDEIVPDEMPLPLRQRLGFTLISHCAFYHLHSEIVTQLVTEEGRAEYFNIDELTEYIAAVTLASAEMMSSKFQILPIATFPQ